MVPWRIDSPCGAAAHASISGAMRDVSPVHVIGAGLAGSEAAWQLAEAGVPVVLHEMRPATLTPAHKTGGFAELVCSNSFRSDDWETNAVGLLHAEMRRAGSLIMMKGDAHQVPAGGALAVDREGFSIAVTEAVKSHPLVEVEIGTVEALPPPGWGLAIVATGPLTAPGLAASIAEATGEGQLAFFDAIAPIVYRDTVDFDVAWFQSRYDKAGPGGSGADYINCPLDRDQYEAYQREARERWGDTDAYRQSAERTQRYDREDWQAIKDEADAVTARLAELLDADVPATSTRAMDAAEEHRRHIHRWFYDCPHEMHAHLGEMYVTDQRFTATYDEVRPGLATYVRDAIVANAERAGPDS
jgi:hypothetical protein